MKKPQKKTKEESSGTEESCCGDSEPEESCCSDSNACPIECGPKPERSKRDYGGCC